MIAGLRGTVEALAEDHLLVNLGAVTLRVFASRTTLDALGDAGESVHLHTHLEVREDTLDLYGFATAQERELFQRLIGVAGVGPRLALAVLSAAEPGRLLEALGRGDVDFLTTVPGVGRKTASRLVLELRGWLETLEPVPSLASETSDHQEIIDALVGLGYTVAEASSAVAALPDDASLGLEEKVRLALRQLAPP